MIDPSMDANFTKQIQDWLNAKPDERDYSVGALYLLKLSGNRIMYRNLVARDTPQTREYIGYQLQKYYNFRVADLTHKEVAAMDAQVAAIVAEHIPLAATADADTTEGKGRGKRADHDTLPDSIKALYVENLSLLQRMRELHLKLRSLSLENATCPDSERYPFLKELISLDKKLHSNWERYDHYIPTDEKDSKPKRNSRAARPKA